MLATLMVSSTMMAGNVKKSTTLPIVGEVVKASHPMIQYVGRVSFAKNPDVASFNYPGTTIEASFQGSSLKMLCRPKSGYFMAQIDGCEVSVPFHRSDSVHKGRQPEAFLSSSPIFPGHRLESYRSCRSRKHALLPPCWHQQYPRGCIPSAVVIPYCRQRSLAVSLLPALPESWQAAELNITVSSFYSMYSMLNVKC